MCGSLLKPMRQGIADDEHVEMWLCHTALAHQASVMQLIADAQNAAIAK